MKFIVAAGLALSFAPIVLSSPTPAVADASPAINKRVVPITPPQASVECLGYTVSTNNILAAINQGLAWATTSPPTQKGSGSYPHVFKNYENINFPNCAGSTIWEYPVLRYGSNPWVPAGKSTKLPTGPNGEKEPDRVIFAPTNANTVTYCGTITHDPNKLTSTGKTGAFVICTV